MAARDRAPAPEAGRAVVTSAPRPVWPITAGLVVVGLCLLAWDVFGAVITTAPFFGDQPSRNDVIESGMVLVTSAVPVVMLCVVGVQAGSRLGPSPTGWSRFPRRSSSWSWPLGVVETGPSPASS